MQSDIMPVQLFQLSPQLASIQTQLRTAIANHQMVFGSYQKDPKNPVLRNKLQEMQLQIRNLSNHQTVIVEQLRGQLIQNAVASTANAAAAAATTTATAFSAPASQAPAPAPQSCSTTVVNVVGTAGAASIPQPTGAAPSVMVTPSSCVAESMPVPMQQSMGARPQLLTLPHGNLGIVVPLAHLQQAQPALMSLQGGVLGQPGAIQTSGGQPHQPLVSLQLSVSSGAGPAAILTSPTPAHTTTTPVTTAANCATASKQSQENEGGAKTGQSALRAIQPRPSSPPIKVPHYTINAQSGTGKASEKSNGMIHRSFSDSDAKDLKGNGNHSDKDPTKTAEDKNLIAEKKKMDFMSAIGLVTPDASKAIQNRRVERKRRSTANPHYSYSLERRRNGSLANNGSSWLMGTLPTKRAKGRQPKHSPSPANSCPGSPDTQGIHGVLSENKGERCAECGKDGRLLLCGTCSLMYHLDCLSPPLAAVPESPWSCAACIVSGKSNGVLSNGALSMVNSYITVKANKEDDKKKAQRKNIELLQEKQNLLEKKNTLKQQVQGEKKKVEELEASVQQKTAQLATLKAFVKSFQTPPAPAPVAEPAVTAT